MDDSRKIKKKIRPNKLLVNLRFIVFGLLLIVVGIFIELQLLKNEGIYAWNDPELSALHDAMMNGSSNRKEIERWLEKNWQLYRVDDSSLVDAVDSLCPFIFEDEIYSYQNKLENCMYLSLVKQLEIQPMDQYPDFQAVSYDVRVSVPPEKYQPALNIAYTCFSGKFAERLVRLSSHNGRDHLDLHVVGGYSCRDGDSYPDLQLNARQANNLFKHKLSQIKTAVAFIL